MHTFLDYMITLWFYASHIESNFLGYVQSFMCGSGLVSVQLKFEKLIDLLFTKSGHSKDIGLLSDHRG